MSDEIRLQVAEPQAAQQLLEIYRPYVEQTAITFETEVPSAAEFRRRIETVRERFPYLVALQGERYLGYAYVSPFKERAAYDWAVETSIYVRREERGRGIGRILYDGLETCLRAQGILNLNACIAYPAQEDAYLTKDSVLFHEKLGYRMVGEFRQCGYKFHRWYHMVWMEKLIGVHQTQQPPVKSFDEIAGLVNFTGSRCILK